MQRELDEKCMDCGTALEAVIPERGGGRASPSENNSDRNDRQERG